MSHSLTCPDIEEKQSPSSPLIEDLTSTRVGTVAVAVVPWIYPAIDKPHAICFCRKLDLPSQPIRFGFDSIRLQVALEYRCIHACTFRTFPLSILVFLTHTISSHPSRPPAFSVFRSCALLHANTWLPPCRVAASSDLRIALALWHHYCNSNFPPLWIVRHY